MTITAKFSTICPCCNARIAAGSKVEWTKGSPARHVACAVKAVDTRPVTGWGRDGRSPAPVNAAALLAAHAAAVAAQIAAGPVGTYAAVASQWGESGEE